MQVNPNTHQVTVPKLLRGANDAAKITKAAEELTPDTTDLVKWSLDGPEKNAMTQDLQKLRSSLSGKDLSAGQMRAAIMVAGALTSGPTSMVPLSMAERLHTAMATPGNRETFADQVAGIVKDSNDMQGAQLGNLGQQVTAAAVKGGVKGKNAPVALFMTGAALHHKKD